MKTIRFKQIDNYNILDRFDELPDDPVQTQKNVNLIMEDLPEMTKFKQILSARNACNEKLQIATIRRQQINRIKEGAQSALKKTEDEEIRKKLKLEIGKCDSIIFDESKTISVFQRRIEAFDLEIEDLNQILDKKRSEIVKANIAYCHPRRNEIVLTQKEYNELLELYKTKSFDQQIIFDIEIVSNDENEIREKLLKIKGKPQLIDDFRGKEFFYKNSKGQWSSSGRIEKLGIKKEQFAPGNDSKKIKEYNELSVDEREEIRIQNMTQEQKTEEKEKQAEKVIRESALMKVELEIKGEKNALKLSQEFYKSKMKELGAKYV